MKIGILTQPIHINYGGTLQAYALQKTLKDMGHEAWLVRREPYQKKNLDFWIRTNLGNIVRYLMHQPLRRWTWLGPKPSPSREVVERNIQSFTNSWINPKTEYIYSTEGLKSDFLNRGYDAYIVGSDQVWRPRFNDTDQTNFWLDFLGNDNKVLRISYAASFGTENWEYKGKMHRTCCELAHRFDSISVREESGVELLRKYFGIDNAIHVLDPTLLLIKNNYLDLISADNKYNNKKYLMSYLLDFKDENIKMIADLAMEKGLAVRAIRPQKKAAEYRLGDNDEDFVIPPIEEWLQGFFDAEYVITDSFHGTVFSIIFNKPFVTIGNQVRGTARLESLLHMFGLEERFLTNGNIYQLKVLIDKKIDWDKVNQRHDDLRKKSLDFLNNALKG